MSGFSVGKHGIFRLVKPSSLSILAGTIDTESKTGQRRSPRHIFVHPKYVNRGYDLYDLTVITTEEPFKPVPGTVELVKFGVTSKVCKHL